MTPVVTEPLLGYHPLQYWISNRDHELVGDKCQVGSLTGAVASKGYRRRSRFPSEWTETIRRVQRQKRSLTATPTVEQVRKGLSDPVV